MPDVTLRLKIGVAAGEIFVASLGGALERYEYVAYGLPVRNSTLAQSLGQQGELIVPSEFLEYVGNSCDYTWR